AKLLTSRLRSGDVACRYGGEEFVVLIPGADVDAARQRAEDWRVAFEVARTRAGGRELSATVSLGVASFPAHGADREAVLRAADRALYRSKSEGRNRTTAAWLEHAGGPA